MASRQAHEQRALHNEQFAGYLRSPSAERLLRLSGEAERAGLTDLADALRSDAGRLRGCLDWQVVILFYAALHWADAYLATLGIDPGSHSAPLSSRRPGRNRLVERHLPEAAEHYFHLHNLSTVARYLPHLTIGPGQADEAFAHYQAFKQHVTRLLG